MGPAASVMEAPRPTRVSKWLPIAGFALLASANQMMWLNFAPITTGAATHLHVSKSAIGTLSEIFPLLYVLLAVPIGRALDRWFRLTLLAGATLTVAGGALRLVGTTYGWILLGQVLIAIAQPAILNAITGTASRYLHEDHRPLGIAVGSAGTFLGFILAFVVGEAFGAGRIHALLVVSAIYGACAAVVLAATVAGQPAVALRETTGRAGGTGLESVSAFRALWEDRVLRTLTVLVFVGFGVFIALTTWAETLLKPAGISSSTTDVLLTVMVVAGLAGSIVIPPLAAERSWQARFIMASAAVIVAGCTVLATGAGVAGAAIALAVIGLLLLPDLPVILDLAERRAGVAGGTATAFLWLAGNAGGIVIALVIQGVQGSPAVAFGVMAAIGLVAAPLALVLGRQLAGDVAAAPA